MDPEFLASAVQTNLKQIQGSKQVNESIFFLSVLNFQFPARPPPLTCVHTHAHTQAIKDSLEKAWSLACSGRCPQGSATWTPLPGHQSGGCRGPAWLFCDSPPIFREVRWTLPSSFWVCIIYFWWCGKGGESDVLRIFNVSKPS